ncbi:MAG: diaminopropionate ammonia-lyase [Deltaproteobacteria bacterium]|nr:diaminopropionate ammonia-lyase [Deltaproteobacteria bacterium]MBN2846303.1 diaminopropionate ammonia-lyase [Deltaproteobacteria bacterium]
MKIHSNSHPLKVDVPSVSEIDEIAAFHSKLPGYVPTPLVSIDGIAKELGIRRLLVKDEGKRFGLKAFKALGASYAVYKLLQERDAGKLQPEEFLSERGKKLAEGITFTCATDGNHGRALAWIARLLGRKAVIFMPQGSVPSRIDAIRSEGADVVVVEGGYDDAVRRASEEAEKKGWVVIADVGYPGYMEIPRYIQMGYMTIFRETINQLVERGEKTPDIVFLQAGVGAFASASALYFNDPADGIRLVSVEPGDADCLFRSAEAGDGTAHSSPAFGNTIMAGLNCETPSMAAWPIVRDRFDCYITIEDHYAEVAMRVLTGEGIVAGESGAAGLGGLIALLEEDPSFAEEKLQLRDDAHVLVINTEADTDPEGYRRIVGTIG